jgi:mannitol-specific phosphotransferase system IIBC component
MAVVSTLTTLAGGAVSAYGKSQQSRAQSDAYKYSANAMDAQAKLAKRTSDINSKLVQDSAAREATEYGRKIAGVYGAQKVAVASNMGGGSVTEADILRDTFTKAKLDEMAIRHNADIKTWGIRNEAENEVWGLGIQKNQYLKAAKNARKAGAINVASSILSTASSIADTSMRYRGGYSPKLYND